MVVHRMIFLLWMMVVGTHGRTTIRTNSSNSTNDQDQDLPEHSSNGTTVSHEWTLDCTSGLLEPGIATFTTLVDSVGSGQLFLTEYSIDFVMQWSDYVNFTVSFSNLEIGLEYELPLTYLYSTPGVYNTVFTSIYRTETGQFPNGYIYNRTATVFIKEEDCLYPYNTAAPTAVTIPQQPPPPTMTPIIAVENGIPTPSSSSAACLLLENSHQYLLIASISIVCLLKNTIC